MIVSCDGCRTRYLLDDEKVPQAGIRVRCPKCRFVWKLTPPPVTIDSGLEISSSPFDQEIPSAPEVQQGGWGAMQEQGRSAVATEPAAAPEIGETEVEIGGQEPAPEPEKTEIETPEMKKKRDRARRLARVFVSDILVYNREKRDQGLAGGDLMTVLGPEIKKAWEAYKEKIGSEVSESSDYFRDALNEILADGQNVF